MREVLSQYFLHKNGCLCAMCLRKLTTTGTRLLVNAWMSTRCATGGYARGRISPTHLSCVRVQGGEAANYAAESFYGRSG